MLFFYFFFPAISPTGLALSIRGPGKPRWPSWLGAWPPRVGCGVDWLEPRAPSGLSRAVSWQLGRARCQRTIPPASSSGAMVKGVSVEERYAEVARPPDRSR